MTTSGFNTGKKNFTVNFTVKNVSSKNIRVFGFPIPPGRQRDLLAIPYVGEDDIRSSLIKGELYNKLQSGEINVVTSSNNLVTFDDSFKNYLGSRGVSGITIALPDTSQATWFIDAVNGDDVNDGATAATALASWGELVERLGPNPVFANNNVAIIILSDLEEVIGFTNMACESVQVSLTGNPIVTASGTLTGASNVNRTGGSAARQEIEQAAFDWTPYVGMLIRLSNGAMAWIDEVDPTGGGVSTASTSRFYDVPSFSAYSPVGNETWEVLRLPKVEGMALSGNAFDFTPSFDAPLSIELLDFEPTGGSVFGRACYQLEFGGGAFPVVMNNCRINTDWLRFGQTPVSCSNVFLTDSGTSVSIIGNNAVSFTAGLISTGTLLAYTSNMSHSTDMLTRAKIALQPGSTITVQGNGLGSFVSGGNAFTVSPGCTLNCGDRGIYGTGAALAFKNQPGGTITYATNPPTGIQSVADPANTQNGDAANTLTYAGGAPDWATGDVNRGAIVQPVF